MLSPTGIAIVGASDASGWSRYTYSNLIRGGYPHDIHLVNRRGGRVHDRPAARSLTAIGEPVDLAYVLTGPDSLPGVLADAHDAGIRDLVVIAAGFGETGAEGRRRERDIVELAERYGQRILGPNNLGYINAAARTMPWSQLMPWPLLTGGVGVLSQSGALGIFLLNYLESRDVGVSHLVSLGNEAMITVAEGVDHLVRQEQTRVIALYLESVRHPQAFLAAARRALAAGKPVVAYKAGRGEVGARVTAAHTGSLATDERVLDAVLRQHGVIRVDSIEDLVTTCGLLDAYAPLPGGRVAFVTASGAMCAAIGDAADANGLDLPDLAPDTVQALRDGGLPDFATAQNPLDITGYVVIDTNLMGMSEQVVSRDPNIDVLVVHGSVPATPEAAEVLGLSATRRARLAADSRVPVIPMDFLPVDRTPFAREFRRRNGLPYVVDSFTRGVPALARAIRWSELTRATPDVGPPPVTAPLPQAHERSGLWTEARASALLAAHGVPTVPARLVHGGEEAARVAAEFAVPVVLKVCSADLEHKTDVGGVALDIPGPDEARTAYDRIVRDVTRAAPHTRIDGVLVSPRRVGGVELLVGVVRDPLWGLTLALAPGGVWVERMDDAALRLLPVGRGEIHAMLRELRAFPLLAGGRGEPPADLAGLVEVVAAVAGLALALGDDLQALEVNPLLVRGDRVEALDALLRWR